MNIDELLKLGVKRSFLKGELIKSYDDTNTYYILEGRVEVSRNELEKEIVLPFFYQCGDFVLSETDLVKFRLDLEMHALSSVSCLVFSKDISERYIYGDKDIFYNILKRNIEITSNASYFYYIKSRSDAKSALAYLLNLLSEDGLVDYKEYTSLYRVLDISRSMFSRLGRDLRGEGLIAKDKNIKILNKKILKNYYSKFFKH